MANNTENRGNSMTDRDVLHHIMGDVKYLRDRIDVQGRELTDHIKDEAKYQTCVQKQLSNLEKTIAVSDTSQNIKISGFQKMSLIVAMAIISSFVSLVFASFV
jgi:hypothetical protein